MLLSNLFMDNKLLAYSLYLSTSDTVSWLSIILKTIFKNSLRLVWIVLGLFLTENVCCAPQACHWIKRADETINERYGSNSTWLDSTRLDSTHSTCRAHAFWLCRASRTAQLDSLDTTSSTGSTGSTCRARLARLARHVELDWLDTSSSTGATCNLVMITVIHIV